MNPRDNKLTVDFCRKAYPAFDRWCNKSFEWSNDFTPLSSLRVSISCGLIAPSLLDLLRAEGKDYEAYCKELLPHYTAAVLAMECDFPFYLVSKNILEALLRTKPPRYWDQDSVRLGFPSMYFVLPKGVLTGDNGEPVDCLSVSHDDKRILFTATSVEKQVNWHSTLTWTGGVVDLEDIRRNGVAKSKYLPEDDLDKVLSFVEKLPPLIFQILLLFSVRPEVVEEGELLRTTGKAGAKREWWRPRFVGRRYTSPAPGEGGGGTHASPETHWRMAHWRQQHYGPQNSKVKSVWIDKIWVNPPK